MGASARNGNTSEQARSAGARSRVASQNAVRGAACARGARRNGGVPAEDAGGCCAATPGHCERTGRVLASRGARRTAAWCACVARGRGRASARRRLATCGGCQRQRVLLRARQPGAAATRGSREASCFFRLHALPRAATWRDAARRGRARGAGAAAARRKSAAAGKNKRLRAHTARRARAGHGNADAPWRARATRRAPAGVVNGGG
jgi:hypothetical protein